MHFGFKSTFNTIKNKTTLFVRKTFRKGIRHYLLAVLMINLSALFLAMYFYLDNLFIPAVYGSKPTGALWIRLFSFLAFAWIISTTYSAVKLLAALPLVRKATASLHAWVEPRIEKYLPVINFILLRVLFLLSSIIYLVSRKPKPYTVMFNPKYHNNESKANPSSIG